MDTPVHSPASPNGSRKRPRDNETASQRLKREKAAERQRRKRERDRNAAGMGIMAFPPSGDPQQQQQQSPQQQMQQQPHQSQTPQPSSAEFGQELTPEEAARRDRVRAAARERQRKHRQLVKQRKMRDLGIEMGTGEMVQHIEEVPYRVNNEGQFPQVLQSPHQFPPPHHPPPPMAQGEPPFPQDQPLGQTFASTLLLSFSCAPLLKQHLLRTLNMTNEDLINLEPIIAKAWDHWDQQRRMHYAEQAAQGGGAPQGMPPGPPPFAVDMAHEHPGGPNAPHPYPPPGTTGPGAPGANGDPSQTPNEFRARFHRSLVAPSPFRTYSDAQANVAAANSTTSNGASGSGHPPTDPIDPHLSGPNGAQANQGTVTPKTEVRS